MPGRGTPNAKHQPTPASCLINPFFGLSGYPGPLASVAGGNVLESLRSSLDAFAWLQSVSKSPAAVPLIFQASVATSRTSEHLALLSTTLPGVKGLRSIEPVAEGGVVHGRGACVAAVGNPSGG